MVDDDEKGAQLKLVPGRAAPQGKEGSLRDSRAYRFGVQVLAVFIGCLFT